ncbi:MAG: hypothetical protein C4328_09955 [Meiothermus sp.]
MEALHGPGLGGFWEFYRKAPSKDQRITVRALRIGIGGTSAADPARRPGQRVLGLGALTAGLALTVIWRYVFGTLSGHHWFNALVTMLLLSNPLPATDSAPEPWGGVLGPRFARWRFSRGRAAVRPGRCFRSGCSLA